MKEKNIDLLELIKVIWKRKVFIIIFVFITTSISIGISLLLPKWYKATARILPSSEGQSPLGMLGGFGSFNFAQMFGGNSDQFRILSILKSRNLKENVVRKFNLQERYHSDYLENAIKKFNENMDVGIGDEMQIYIHIWDQDQDMIADITNYAVQCLDSINIAIASKKASQTRQFLAYRIDEVIDSLLLLEGKLSEFMEGENIISLEDQIRVSVESAAQLRSEIIMAEIELAVTRKMLSPSDPKIMMLKNRLSQLNRKYSECFSENTSDKLFPDFRKVPELGIGLKNIERKTKYYDSLLEFLGPQYEKAKIEEKQDIPTIEVVDWAARPDRKDKPHRALIVIIVFCVVTFLSSSYVVIKEKK
ncbi:MAG: hypothetical protein KAW56_11365 [Candidatus Marinimicrobia bacterium]|nr:hypothetical protein [Candidatus Neomarinimicrobiota bacterium]